ncbi:UNVERIFIED_CONTAM: hypothetical protein FKN15_076414 [Acipenser sinensis]
MDTPEDERTKLISCLGAFRQYWSTLPQESHDQCVQWIVRFIHGQHSPKRISFLYDCLAMAVETGLLPPRMVCEALINSDNLEWERTQLWALTFRLIRKIIGGVDYKGVRDLLKALLEKIQSIPNTVSSAVVQQLLAAREVIEYILDRNACLLPAYFAITEIRKLYPEGKLSHWLLGNLISDFVDSFRATARINSICGRCSLLPVVNNSGAICNSWKLDPTTLRFPLRGLLPYDKDLFEPQTGLLRYVLEQPYSRDMVCNMLGLNKQAMRSHEGNEAQVCYFIIQLLLLKPNDFRNRVSDFVKENFPEHWMQNDWHTKHMNYHKAMRSHEGNEAQVCYFIIQLLLLKPNDFRNRVSDFVKENFPEHWMQNDWHTKHMNYHKKYPEKLYFEGLAEQVSPPLQIEPQYLPIYFGNVCLRFLPVFDIVIHRFLELLPVSKSLETLLDHLGGLYKFHDRPVTYLYNTLHYYEKHLRDRTNLKRKLVHAIISSLKENRTQGWCLSETYLKCAMNAREDNPWIPDDTYYCKLIGRLVDNILSLSKIGI